MGCTDGKVHIYDVLTRNIISRLVAHVQPVSRVEWTRSGRRLVSVSSDHLLVLWDALSAMPLARLELPAALVSVSVHPTSNCLAVASLHVGAPVLVLFDHPPQPSPAGPTVAARCIQLTSSQAADAAAPVERQSAPELAVFSRDGAHVLTSHGARGLVSAWAAAPLIACARLQSASASDQVLSCGEPGQGATCVALFEAGNAIKQLTLARSGTRLLVNCADRSIRMYSKQQPREGGGWEQTHRFEDKVNNVQWKAAAFSANEDYVLGGTAATAKHSIYIWDASAGTLSKILDGPKAGIVSLEWHPLRPVAVSCSTQGVLYLWGAPIVESWSAFAADFQQLEENVYYVEREDEFDVVADEDARKHSDAAAGETPDSAVDVHTIDKYPFEDAADFAYRDEDGLPELTWLPVTPMREADVPVVEKLALAAVTGGPLVPIETPDPNSAVAAAETGARSGQLVKRRAPSDATDAPAAKRRGRRAENADGSGRVRVEISPYIDPEAKPEGWDSWSVAKQKAFLAIETAPNAYYYRHTAPGVPQINGKWSDEEKAHFLQMYALHGSGAATQWGLFAMHVPGRVGYQCRSQFINMIREGLITDTTEDEMKRKPSEPEPAGSEM